MVDPAIVLRCACEPDTINTLSTAQQSTFLQPVQHIYMSLSLVSLNHLSLTHSSQYVITQVVEIEYTVYLVWRTYRIAAV